MKLNAKYFQIKRKSINKKAIHKSGSTSLIRMILFSNDTIIDNVGISQSAETLGY